MSASKEDPAKKSNLARQEGFFSNSLISPLMDKRISKLVDLTKEDGSPNINALWMQLKDLNAVKLSVKQQGYALGRAVYEHTKTLPVPDQPPTYPLENKCSAHADVQSEWFLYWMAQLQVSPLPHRKLWEFGWILQNLHAAGMLKPGHRALGFGCGMEPLPSYFAGQGIEVVATDLEPEEVAGRGWAETGQHSQTLESIYKSNLVDRGDFEKNVSLDYVDMNKIPSSYDGTFDFCWSVCALEHLGSIQNGLTFIEDSLRCLRPGGIAIHTTEFNYTEQDLTVDNWPTVLFLRKHFEELSNTLAAKGHHIAPLNFDVGLDPLDGFIDLPPYSDLEFLRSKDGYHPGHLKLSVDGFPCTCFGFMVQKAA